MTIEQAGAMLEFAKEVHRLRNNYYSLPRAQGLPAPDSLSSMDAPQLILEWSTFRKYGARSVTKGEVA